MAEIVQLTPEQEAEFSRQTAESQSALLQKPAITLDDGSAATVHSIGVGDKQGEWVIPTIVGGKKISDDEAIRLWKVGTNKPIGGPFKTPDEATRYAQDFHKAEERRIAQPVQLTPAQEADFRQQTGTLDPILDFSTEQIAELAKQDTEGFDLVSEFQRNRKRYADPAIAQKAADALDLIESQTSVIGGVTQAVLHPARTVGRAVGATFDIGKNMGRIAWRMLTEAPTAVGAAIGEKLDVWAGVDPGKTAEVRREAQRKVAEAWSGIESSTAGLGMQIARAPGKIQQMAGKKRTPEEKLDHLFKRAGEVEQIQKAVSGKGEFMTAVGGDVIRELEAAGKPVDPVVASELAAGDPFVWWAFGKAFHGAGKIAPDIAKKTGAALAGDLGDIAAQAGGRTLQGLGVTAKSAATTTGKLAGAAPAAGLVGGLVQGGPVGALAGLKGGEITARAVKRGAGLVEKAAVKAAEVGKQIAGVTPTTFPVAQVARDVLQTLPAASGIVAKGAALDIGLAALTSETPAEMEHMISVGTALGAVGAGRRIGGRVISGQLVAPRAWGSKTPVASSGQYPTLDALHSTSIRTSPPGIVERLNAVRQFVSGAAPGTDVFFVKDDASIEKILLDMGMSPERAKLFGSQLGFFTPELPDKNGIPRRVVVVKNIDAAPHESFHPFQDVIGEEANRGIDEVMRRVYADQWESLGQRYAAGFVGQEGTWRDTILNASGWGRAEAIEKIVREIETRYLDQTGSPAPEGLAEQTAAETWKRALSEIRLQNPDAPMGDLQREAWRGILTEQEANAVADRYLARELAAETFDAAFKNLGQSLQEQKGIVPWLARIAAKTTSLLGGEPLAGRVSDIRQVPLSSEAVEAVTGAVRGRVPAVEPTGITPPAVTARRAPATIPTTPEARSEAAAEAQAIATSAAQIVPPGGTRSPRELLGDIAAAIAQQVGVKLNYLSAKDEPAAAITSNRVARRAMIELFRNAPASMRAMWEKTFFPERLIQTGKGIQVLGWAPEVFAANAHKVAQSVGDKSALIPYPIDPKTKTFTDAGWQELFRDTQTAVRNYMGGRTGAGESLVVPADLQERGFYKPPVSGAAAPLDQRKADFINLLFGIPLPGTPRITKGKLPLNIAGQEISAATQPGRVLVPVEPRAKFGEGGASRKAQEANREAAAELGITGREILEVNPLRAELEAAGVKLPGLIEAVQRLDANNIKEVALAPEQPQFRGNTLTLTAGFQPKPENPKAIKKAAVRDFQGEVFTGVWHGEADEAALKSGASPVKYDEDGYPRFEEGFVTNAGEFLNRKQALDRALELQQVKPEDKYALESVEGPGTLETIGFRERRQFQPPREEREMPVKPGQRLIEIIGPDGTVYKARFDGYQGGIPGMEPVAQITPVNGFPFQGDAKHSTTYEPTLIKRGYKVPELPTPEQWESEREETGFTQFQPKPDPREILEIVRKLQDERTLSGKQFKSIGGYFPTKDDYDAASTWAMQGLPTDRLISPRKNIVEEIYSKLKKPFTSETQFQPKRDEWVNDALREVRNPRGKNYVFYSDTTNKKEFDEAARLLKQGYTTKEYLEFPNLVRKSITDLLNVAEAQGSIDFGQAYYPRLAGDKTQFQPTSPKEEFEFEKDFAKDIIAGKKKIEDYQFYSDYEKTIGIESSLVTPGGNVIFIGTGPMPMSQLLLERKLGRPVDGLELSPEASKLGKEILKKAGVNGKIITGDAALFPDFSKYKTVFVALDAGESASDKSKILENISKSLPYDGRIIVRTSATEGGFPTLDKTFSKFFTEEKREPIFGGLSESVVLKSKNVLAQFENSDTLKSALQKDGWALITATQESIGDGTHPLNKAANEKLAVELENSGYEFLPIEGVYKGINQGLSYLIPGITTQEAASLGKKYGQESVLIPEGLLYGDGTVTPAKIDETLVGPEAEKQDFYSKIGDTSFSIPLDFSAERKPAQFQPRKTKKDDLKFVGTKFNQPSKAWILPDGTVAQLGAQWHHDWLDQNKDVQARYKLNVPPFEGGDAEGVREAALKKGFARLNLINDGLLSVEARERDWKRLRPQIEDIIERNLDNVDRFRVNLLNDAANDITKSYSAKIFDLDSDKEKMDRVYETFAEGAQREVSGQFQPSMEVAEEYFQRKSNQLEYIVNQFKKYPGEPVNWPVVPAARLKKIWLDFGKSGIVRDEKGMQKIADQIMDNIARLSVSTELTGHTREAPRDIIRDAGFDLTDAEIEKLSDSLFDASRLSDFAINKLEPLLLKLAQAKTSEDQLYAVDRILNVIHQRSDLASNFIEGGHKTLDEIFEQGVPTGQFQPRRPEQEQLFGGREALSTVELSNMTKQEIADHFPEAVIPSKRDEKIPSEITKSPLYKRSDDPVAAFANKLVAFANKYKDDPVFKAGAKWYSEFTPMLKREFGADAQLMAELLAATSPQTPPNTNFGYAFDALEGFKSGRFKKTIDKFNQGLDMLAEDRWTGWYNKELKAGNIPAPPAEPTPAAFLEHWIATHDLKPRQSNGKLYGQHSLPVLQVFVRRWLELNKGLKTRNFVENLTGISHEATIDLWADRTMRRIGYEGEKERWRILPQNGTGVTDEDFSFAQKVYRAAADRLKMNPDDLQGALWFAEKSLWADNGWGRLDLGDFRKEMEKLPLLRAGVRHRLERTAAGRKAESAEETELIVEPRKLK